MFWVTPCALACKQAVIHSSSIGFLSANLGIFEQLRLVEASKAKAHPPEADERVMALRMVGDTTEW